MLRIAKSRSWRAIGRVYVELVRNTPPLVLVFIFFYFIGNQLTDALGIDAWIRAAGPGTRADRDRALLGAGALRRVPLRGDDARGLRGRVHGGDRSRRDPVGREGPDRGRVRARAHPADQYRFVILPQALRTISPALAGQFISTIKDSAIVAVISVQELTFRGLELMSATFRTFEVWITVTVLYFLLTGGLSLAARALERRLTRRAAR